MDRALPKTHHSGLAMTSDRPIRVLIFWSRISGYMAASWKRLSGLDGIDLSVVAWSVSAAKDNAAFDESIVNGLNCHLYPPQVVPLDELSAIADQVQPDIVVVPGWIHPSHRKLAIQLKRRFGCRVVMGMDTPWTGTPKQRLSQVVRRAQLRHVDHVFTAGSQASDYAKRLGFSTDQITEVVYAWDEQLFGRVAIGQAADTNSRRPEDVPSDSNGFLFVGRYVPEKGLADLLDAYTQYRRAVADPWPLTCCGTGPLGNQLSETEGVQDRGFQAPEAIPAIMRRSRAFLFPSTYEPWGVALAEAMGAGLPAISTDACGAARDLIQQDQNGRIIPASSPDALLEGMVWLHHHPDRESLGREATRQAERFTTAKWATRWQTVFNRLLENEPPVSNS